MAELLPNPRICGECSKPGCELRCACNLIFYCGKECQRAHWPTHKKKCSVSLARNIKDARKEHGRDCGPEAQARIDAGMALWQQGRFGQAEKCYSEALRIIEELKERCEQSDKWATSGPAYARTQVTSGEATARVTSMLGGLYWSMGEYDEAIGMHKANIKIYRTLHGQRSQEVGMSFLHIGQCLNAMSDNTKAVKKLDKAISIFTEACGPESDLVGIAFGVKAGCFVLSGKPLEALALYEESIRISKKTKGSEMYLELASADDAGLLGNMAIIYSELGKLEEAQDAFKQTLAILRRVHGEKHPDVATAFLNIGVVLEKQGEHEEAHKMYIKALKVKRRIYGDEHADVAWVYLCLGSSNLKQRRFEDAAQVLRKGIASYQSLLGPDNARNARMYYNLALAQQGSGEIAEALESVEVSLRIYDKHGAEGGLWTEMGDYNGPLLASDLHRTLKLKVAKRA